MNKNNFQAILFPKSMRAAHCVEWLKTHNNKPNRLIEPIENF